MPHPPNHIDEPSLPPVALTLRERPAAPAGSEARALAVINEEGVAAPARARQRERGARGRRGDTVTRSVVAPADGAGAVWDRVDVDGTRTDGGMLRGRAAAAGLTGLLPFPCSPVQRETPGCPGVRAGCSEQDGWSDPWACPCPMDSSSSSAVGLAQLSSTSPFSSAQLGDRVWWLLGLRSSIGRPARVREHGGSLAEESAVERYGWCGIPPIPRNWTAACAALKS